MSDRDQRDPAPSRLAYRLERLWLRPVVRHALRVGVPALAVVGAVGWWASDDARVSLLTDAVAEARRAVEERPEFMVHLMAVDGASLELANAVHETVHVDFPVSSFDLDLDAIRTDIAAIDAVADVRVRIRPGGVLQVDIDARKPALVWRSNAGLILVDPEGHPIAATPSRRDWGDLPLMAGPGAHRAAAEALELFAAAAPLHPRLRGLHRRGERRWDLVLTDGQRIMLPAEDPLRALSDFLAMDATQDVLSRAITHVDLRLPTRKTVRLTAHAKDELNRMRAVQAALASSEASLP